MLYAVFALLLGLTASLGLNIALVGVSVVFYDRMRSATGRAVSAEKNYARASAAWESELDGSTPKTSQPKVSARPTTPYPSTYDLDATPPSAPDRERGHYDDVIPG